MQNLEDHPLIDAKANFICLFLGKKEKMFPWIVNFPNSVYKI